MTNKEEFHLKEYESLRQEMLALVQASADLERWSLIGSAAIVSFYFSEHFPRGEPKIVNSLLLARFAL
jgi:hypothetical protein